MTNRALLLVNPAARRGREGLAEALDCLPGHGIQVIPDQITEPRQVGDLIRRHIGVIDRVIVAGGDGTLNTVAQGLVGTGLPMGIIPLGTANNLARTLEIPTALSEACRLAANGARRPIDLGWVNGRYFFTTASIGLSVQITEALTSKTKRRWGALAYGVAALRALRQSHPFHADISWKGGSRHSRSIQIVVGNGRYYGSALPVAEDARIDDAMLDLYSIEVHHWWELLALVPALRRGRQGEKQSVEALRATEFEITTRVPLDINVDGEICSQTPAHLRVHPGALEVFAPVKEVS
jgi:YegS/Rv2252/BmrU family lipid kinase